MVGFAYIQNSQYSPKFHIYSPKFLGFFPAFKNCGFFATLGITIEPGYLNSEDGENLLPPNAQYRQVVDALLYIATISRPVICAAINILSRRNEKPRKKD